MTTDPWGVLRSLSRRRSPHVAQTLENAAEAAGEPAEQFVEKAVADERREELLARTLTIAPSHELPAACPRYRRLLARNE